MDNSYWVFISNMRVGIIRIPDDVKHFFYNSLVDDYCFIDDGSLVVVVYRGRGNVRVYHDRCNFMFWFRCGILNNVNWARDVH
jgi:hypothetical protein